MMRVGFMTVGFAVALVACGSSATPSTSGSQLPGNGGAAAGGVATEGSGGVQASSGGASGGSTPSDAGKVTGEDFVATASTFQCIQRGMKIGNFYLVNELGHSSEAVAVANDANGGRYPVGTIIQLIPTEAMVKRGVGFSSDTNDWEFFSLTVTAGGTQIGSRGTKDVVNQFNGNCFDCHSKAEPQFDFVCEETHGCDPLPFTPQVIQAVQESDPRCP